MNKSQPTCIADASFIDDSLQPYSWYKNFVLAGAEEDRLPAEYVESRIGTDGRAIRRGARCVWQQ